MIQKESVSIEEGKFHIPAESMNIDERVKVLNHAETFAIFDLWGDIQPDVKKAQGIFHEGTRFVNRLELRLNGRKPILLSSAIREDNDVFSIDLTNHDLPECNVPENSLHIARSKFLRNAVYYEEISIANYNDIDCCLDINLTFGSDFKDLFEIRGISRTVHPNKTHLRNTDGSMLFDYFGLDNVHRRTEIMFLGDIPYTINNNSVTLPLTLQPRVRQKIEFVIVFRRQDELFKNDQVRVADFNFEKTKTVMRKELNDLHNLFASISTSNEQFTHWIHRSQADLISLLTKTQYGLYPFAGVPWYNTPFGRDGIITAMEVLWMAPEIAKNVLVFLSKMQAKEYIPAKDAEPGKILHEARSGEMANTREIPFGEYYGTVDATPLYVALAGMYFKQTADIETIKNIWPQIKNALAWIDEYGDLDGDGFVEYKHKAENGLTNQGWKDSHDSIMYESGALCEPPIALCEVQGYVYAAKHYGSLIASHLQEKEYAERLTREAEELKKKFNEVFWNDATGYFALALDGNKKRCDVISSNPGHCLFTGIVNNELARPVAEQLVARNMFTGWGIRTLGAAERRYNPMSYHNGSVWPHDNALIAAGLSRYGFQKEAMKVMSSLFDASLFIDMQRLPELYCGFERRVGEAPTAYPVACSPQAWSVAAVFMLIQACLRLEINALEKKIVFDKPELPGYLATLTVSRLKAGDGYCDFEVRKHREDVGFNVITKPADWEIIIRK
jgi:glycogen debranching enzyme